MYRLRTFGGLTLALEGAPVTGPATQRRRLAILAMLAASDTGMSRERIAALLWPDSDAARARHSVDDALSALRRSLGHDDLFLGVGTLRLNPAVLGSDVADHAAAIEAGNAERAVELYAGPFLDGFSLPDAGEFERWTEAARQRLARAHTDVLDGLVARAETRGEEAEAVRWCRARVASDPLDTPATLRLIRILTRAGSATEALRLARVHESLIRQELDCEPGPEWADALARLRRELGRAPAAESPSVGTPSVSRGVAGVHDESPIVEPDDAAVTAIDVRQDVPASVADPLAGDRNRRSSAPLRVRLPRRALIALATGITCIVTAGAVWRDRTGPSEHAAGDDMTRVLVLPFENSTGDSTLAPLGRMAADWVAQGLSQVDGLTVTPFLQSAEQGAAWVRRAASESGAHTVVSGNYYTSGDTILVQVQLTAVAGWTLQDAIAPVRASRTTPTALLEPLRQRVMAALAVKNDPRYAPYAAGTTPPTYDAYEQYLAGAVRFEQGDMRSAVPYWMRAAALDTTYVQPLISIADGQVGTGQVAAADTLVRLIERRRLILSPADHGHVRRLRGNIDGDLMMALEGARMTTAAAPGAQLPRMLHASSALRAGFAREAIAVAAPVAGSFGRNRPALPSLVYWDRVTAAHHMLGDYEGELAAARRARAYHPAVAGIASFELRALAALGRIDSLPGRLSELVAMPAPWIGWTPSAMLIDLATELRAHGHAEAAQATARLVLSDAAARPRDQQRSSSLRFDMARASDLLGEDATAASLLDGLLAEAPDDLRFVTYDGLTAAHRGQRERALHAASRLRTLKRPYDRGQTTYARAQLAAALGYAEEALSLLRQSLREGVLYGTALHADPEFASLRSDPAFLVLLAPRD